MTFAEYVESMLSDRIYDPANLTAKVIRAAKFIHRYNKAMSDQYSVPEIVNKMVYLINRISCNRDTFSTQAGGWVITCHWTKQNKAKIDIHLDLDVFEEIMENDYV